jgi:hypothetical protein
VKIAKKVARENCGSYNGFQFQRKKGSPPRKAQEIRADYLTG